MPSSTLRRLAAAGSAASAVLALAACGSAGNGTSSSSSGAAGGTTATVVAKNFSFSPASVPVSAGTVTVTFQNQDSVTHSLTLDGGGGDVVVAGGRSATLTFTAPQSGTVAFHCKFHPSMHGTFTVGGSGGAGAGGSASSSSSSSSSGNGYGY